MEYRLNRRVKEIPEWPLTTGTIPKGGKRMDTIIHKWRLKFGRYIFRVEFITLLAPNVRKNRRAKKDYNEPPSGDTATWTFDKYPKYPSKWID